jgi:hypothetical protein
MSSPQMNGFRQPGEGAAPALPDDLPRVLDIEVDPPVEWNGNTYATLHLEEPTGQMIVKSEQELAQGANFAALRKYQFALVSNASGVPRQAIEKMRISQIQQAFDFLSRFMPSGPATGAS